MSAPPSLPRRRSTAGLLAVLSCAAVLTLSACDTSSESAPSGGSVQEGAPESGHEGGHEGGHTQHSGTPHTTATHHTTAPTSRPSEFNPANCPTGLVCSTPTP